MSEERMEEELHALRRMVTDAPPASDVSKARWRSALNEHIARSEGRRGRLSWLPVVPPIGLVMLRSLSEGPWVLLIVATLGAIYAIGARALFAEAMARAEAPDRSAETRGAVRAA